MSPVHDTVRASAIAAVVIVTMFMYATAAKAKAAKSVCIFDDAPHTQVS